MKLSVVMAVQNGEQHVREAVESVLSQSVSDFEFFIVDDASTDSTPAILSDYQRQDSRIRVLRNETNLGPYPSANRALLCATGDLIARHDADDISPPDRFAVQLGAFCSDPETSLVTGALNVFSDQPKFGYIHRHPTRQARLEWELLFQNVIAAGAHVMFPRVIRGKRVLFPAKYRYAEDYGLYCTLCGLGRVICPEVVVYRYRQHKASITGRNKAEQYECFSQLRQQYQVEHMGSEVPRQASEDVSLFWRADGGRISQNGFHAAVSLLTQLRSKFVNYVEERFGAAERIAFEAEIDDALRQRLAYWVYRSTRFLDLGSIRYLLSTLAARGEALTACQDAARQFASALSRKLVPTRRTLRSN